MQQHDLTNMREKIDRNLEKQHKLKKQKYEQREAFYGSLCEYEIEQTFIKDIEWI